MNSGDPTSGSTGNMVAQSLDTEATGILLQHLYME